MTPSPEIIVIPLSEPSLANAGLQRAKAALPGLATRSGGGGADGLRRNIIRQAAKRAGATVFFADESGIRSDYHAGTTWAPRGKTPIVKATGARYSVTMLSALSSRGDFRFMVHDGTVTAQVFREFLRRLLVAQRRPVFLIVDGHPTHKAKLVRDFVDQQEDRLKLFYLPAYSPELNPDELVWGHIKQRVAKRLAATKDELKRQVQRALRSLQRTPLLVASFFGHPTCAYAA